MVITISKAESIKVRIAHASFKINGGEYMNDPMLDHSAFWNAKQDPVFLHTKCNFYSVGTFLVKFTPRPASVEQILRIVMRDRRWDGLSGKTPGYSLF